MTTVVIEAERKSVLSFLIYILICVVFKMFWWDLLLSETIWEKTSHPESCYLRNCYFYSLRNHLPPHKDLTELWNVYVPQKWAPLSVGRHEHSFICNSKTKGSSRPSEAEWTNKPLHIYPRETRRAKERTNYSHMRQHGRSFHTVRSVNAVGHGEYNCTVLLLS